MSVEVPETTASASQLATILKRHYMTVLRWASKGSIPSITRPGSNILVFNVAEVKAAMVKHNLCAGKVTSATSHRPY